MEQRPSLEANNSSDTQEITRILWKAKVHYRFHNSKPLAPDMSQINPLRVLLNFLGIHFNIIPFYIIFRVLSLLYVFSIGVCHFRIRATCSAHLILS